MDTLRYTALERIRCRRPVDRVGYLGQTVAGRRVLDLGALDETAYLAKKDNGRWLHAQLCKRATYVVGVDNSTLVPDEGLATADNGRILRADIHDLSPVIAATGRPDVVIAGELIEHLPDTLTWLQSLKATPSLAGVEFVFSTPNACSWYNGLIGLGRMESTHPDHLQIYSYKTLRTLFARSGLELLELTPYHARFDEMREASGGIRKLAVSTFERMVQTLEFATPVLAGGWIGRARI